MPDGSLVPQDAVHPAPAEPDATELLPHPALSTHPNVFVKDPAEGGETRDGPASAAPGGELRCAVTGEVCAAERYHCISKPELVLGPSAYAAARFPPPYSAADFVRVGRAGARGARSVGVEWSDLEVLKLLEGLEGAEDDWDKVAEHVGTKSKEECVKQLLRLPIEDRFLDARLEEGVDAGWENGHVASQLAFLCQGVDPAVAQAATKAAFQALAKGPDADAGADEEALQQSASNVVALAAAARRARSLAVGEEREVQRLVAKVVSLQMEKLRLKLRNFDRLEALLVKEREALGRQRGARVALDQPAP
jgi:SWI/SNF related-matrix-associated actin-dependent regulator of chromatin subfamily C